MTSGGTFVVGVMLMERPLQGLRMEFLLFVLLEIQIHKSGGWSI